MYLDEIIKDKLIFPYDDDLMTYDATTKRYVLTREGVLARLNIDLISKWHTPEEVDTNLIEISDKVYDEIYDNPNPYGQEYPEFLIARLEVCRQKIANAMIAQLRYAIRFGKDMEEYNPESLSKSAKIKLRAEPYPLFHKGAYGYRINPKVLGVGY